MLRLLCTGDLHLGRHPSRVPERGRDHSVEAVWQATVAYATEQVVDAVILTGDVVDRENRFYESVGPLQRGIEELSSAGIETFAVAGNHDWDVLPNLVETLDADHFHLLGRGGEWSEVPLRRDGEVAARILGWSFPREYQSDSPLDAMSYQATFPDGADAPVVGVMHAELDQPGSAYAPVPSSQLAGSGADVWLLGHIHAPQMRSFAGVGALYPGSPQPLDPTETGPHGPWVVEIGRDGRTEASMIPLATVRYEHRDVDVAAVVDESDFRSAVSSAADAALEEIERGTDALSHLVLRLRCTGRTDLARRLETFAASAVDELHVEHEATVATVDAIDVNTDPAIELDELLDGRDPPAELARLLVALRDDDAHDDIDAIVEETSGLLSDIHGANAYRPLMRDEETREPPADDEIREMLYHQGRLLLEELLAQDDSGSPGTDDV